MMQAQNEMARAVRRGADDIAVLLCSECGAELYVPVEDSGKYLVEEPMRCPDKQCGSTDLQEVWDG